MSVLFGRGIVEKEHIRSDYSRKNAEGLVDCSWSEAACVWICRASEVGMRGLICARQPPVVAHF